MIKTILLDMDDVLNQFMPYVFEWLGQPEPDQWSGRLVNMVHGLSETEIWERLDYDFWRTIPKSKEFNWLMQLVEGVEVKGIVTGLPPYNQGQCVEGKLEWLSDHLPNYADFKVVFTSEKWLCANPDTLLIDDYKINVQRFREYGGHAVLMPRRWNNGFDLKNRVFFVQHNNTPIRRW